MLFRKGDSVIDVTLARDQGASWERCKPICQVQSHTITAVEFRSSSG